MDRAQLSERVMLPEGPLDLSSRTTAEPGETMPGSADPTFVFGRARFGLSVFLLAGATWFVVLLVRLATVALGIRSAADLSGVLVAVVLVPATAACVAPLLEAGVALLRDRRSAGRWSRIMAEAGAALVFASLASAYDPVLWPGVGPLAVAAVLGFVVGLRRWRPATLAADQEAAPSLLLLLLDDSSDARRTPQPVAKPVTSESEAA